MADKPAAVQGCYVDCRFMPGLKSARISVDIPIEHANEFIRMFGTPDRAAPVSVVLARLAVPDASSGVSRAEGPSDVYTPKQITDAIAATVSIPVVSHQEMRERKRFSEMKRAAQAALKLQDPTFCQWLDERTEDLCLARGGGARPSDADGRLKMLLTIGSKTELDTDTYAGDRWDKLLTDFDTRNYRR